MRKRRQFSPEFKAQVVLDVLTGVQSQAEACRKHGLGANLLALWKTAFLERAHLVFDTDSARSAEQSRIAELEQVLVLLRRSIWTVGDGPVPLTG